MAENRGNGIRLNIGIITIVVLLICQLVAFSFGYGMLTQQVGFNRELIKQYQVTQALLSAKMDDLSTRLTKIETILRGN